MQIEHEVEITITTPTSSYRDGYVSIEIDDKASGLRLMSIDMDKIPFINAAIFRHSNQLAKAQTNKFGMDNIGRIHEWKSDSVRVPAKGIRQLLERAGYGYNDRALGDFCQAHIDKTMPGENWIVRRYFGAQRSVIRHSDDTVTLNFNMDRYLAPNLPSQS